MKRAVAFLSVVVWAALAGLPARAEQHTATRLGNPATRFAPPLSTPDDLRALFRNESLKPDIAAILQQWGWRGNLDDLLRAAAAAEIAEAPIPVGSTMPFMSSRENGRPICLRNVTWLGKAPAPAYAFEFVSNKFRYRCVTPKACSNFFLEDLGKVKPVIPAILLEVVDLEDPVEVGKPVTYVIKVTNQGTIVGNNIRLVCTLPPCQAFVSGDGATAVQAQGDTVTMESLPTLEPKAAASWRVVCKATQAADARIKVALTSDQVPRPVVHHEATQQY
jgi:uncharacterized repeat protein (TIGR01451 family)